MTSTISKKTRKLLREWRIWFKRSRRIWKYEPSKHYM